MRIAYNGWFWHRPETGSGQYLRRLITAFSLMSPENEFYVFHPGDPLPHQSANTHLIALNSLSHPLYKVWWEQGLMPRLARKYEVDLLHIPYWAPPMSTPVPTIVTIHDLIPLILPAYRGHFWVRLYTALVRATTPQATMILTDSLASQKDIKHMMRIPDARISTIHLAADDIYTPEKQPEDCQYLSAYGLKPGYILYLGGFDQRKNVQTLIMAFRIVGKVCEDAVLVIAGKLPDHDSSFSPDPRRLIKEAGISPSNVVFTGYVEEITKPALYRGARLFAHPSIYEGFGYPPLEALMCGTPVVGCDASSLPEVVGDAGILVSPYDTDGMAGAMLQLLNDNELYLDLKCKAQKQTENFNWQKTARQTLNAYKHALKVHT